eukprot:Colp12_sorted_trinity150504_noHs@6123
MGGVLSALTSLFGSMWISRQAHVIMLGLDAAGKTTILYKLKLNETVTTIPTIGFNVETIDHPSCKLQVWDVGGQHKIRPLWKHYYQNCDAVIFVVDSADVDRMAEAREELENILSTPELSEAVVLVMANKMDQPRALTTKELYPKLGLDKIFSKRSGFVQPTCAVTGEGLVDGLNQLTQMLKATEKRRKNAKTPF